MKIALKIIFVTIITRFAVNSTYGLWRPITSRDYVGDTILYFIYCLSIYILIDLVAAFFEGVQRGIKKSKIKSD